ncbi:MAG: aldehyde dehydrogenase family protein [Synechococcaceae cyanobacterium SM2_3_60]|nr:aldehyde dehydrogenase family protein [Synechococcaceae cyanobacterium SM2_3_60]
MLELGSMSPAIIHSDADLALAVERCVFGGYVFAGQVCIHTQRLVIQDSVYDEFMAAYLAQVEALVVGDPLDPATFVGPLIRSEEIARIETWLQEAQAGGQPASLAAEFTLIIPVAICRRCWLMYRQLQLWAAKRYLAR